MPSLRHPVGPLPSSIYWRRRVVVLSAFLAIVALVVWLVRDAGGGGGKDHRAAHRPGPAQSITPGSSPTGPAITSRPGGSSDGGAPGGGTGGGVVGGAGSGGSGASSGGAVTGTGDGGAVSGGGGGQVSLSTMGGTGTGTTGGTATGGAAGSGSAGSGSDGVARAIPVNTTEVMGLRPCPSPAVSLDLQAVRNAYQPGERPAFTLTVRNTGGTPCRVDLGRTSSVITITQGADDRVWSSGDCPADRTAQWAGLGAGRSLTETFVWDRVRSRPQCATPVGGAPGDGTYLVRATLATDDQGPVDARTSFRLES